MSPQEILDTHGPREAMEYDVVVVGAGPAGLSAAIRLKQLAAEKACRAVGGGAGKGLRAGRAHPERRGHGPARDGRALPRLEGARRATEPAGQRRRRAHPARGQRHAHAGLLRARVHAQRRQLRHQPGRGDQVAGRAGRSAGRGDLPRLQRRRSAVRRHVARCAAWPPATWGWARTASRWIRSSSAWNCWASTRCSPKAHVATWASS